MKQAAVHAGFLNDLKFKCEYGGDVFFRNVGWFSSDYTELEDRILHNHRWENHKSKVFLVYLTTLCQLHKSDELKLEEWF
jgi:hypothetical protein